MLAAGMASNAFLPAPSAQDRTPSRQGPARARRARPSSAGAGGSSFCAESGDGGYDSDCGSDGGDDLMDCDGGNGSGGMAKGKTILLKELQQVRAVACRALPVACWLLLAACWLYAACMRLPPCMH
jgi:hypothetical protein